MTAGEEEITVNPGRTLRPMRFLPLAVAALALVLTASAARAAQSAPEIGAGHSISSSLGADSRGELTIRSGEPVAALAGTTGLKGAEVAAVTALPRAGAGMAVTVALPGEAALFALLASSLVLLALAVARHRPTI